MTITNGVELMEYNENYEIYKFIELEADNFTSMEDILKEYKLTFEQAYENACRYRSDFFSLLKSHGIKSDIPEAILIDICKQMDVYKDEDILKIYCMAVTDKGLLFEKLANKEQIILLWLEQSRESKSLMAYLKNIPVYKNIIETMSKSAVNNATEKIDLEEQANLYQMALQHGFIYKNGKNNTFLSNIGELIRLTNSNKFIKSAKPYVYSAVLSRKHKMMIERADYSPNLQDVFKLKEYKIDTDNGKNFNTYQSYLELYEQLKRHYIDDTEVDTGFSDYCFRILSNLSEWYYHNCEPNEDIPRNFRAEVTSYFTDKQFLNCDIDCDYENPVMEIAFENTINDNVDILKEFVNQRYNGEDTKGTIEKLCKLSSAEKMSGDAKNVKKLAENYLLGLMEENINNMLIDAIEEFI